jgi:sugar phosphate isomerase/epimerase
MGIAVIVFGSPYSRNAPEGFGCDRATDQLLDHLRRWGSLATRAGVTLALEPLHRGECNIVNTVDEGADLVRRADHPGIRLLADTYHMLRENESPDAIRRAKGLIVHVHCAEGDGRGPLGAIGEDHRPFFRALKDIGYDGRVSIEATWRDFDSQLPAAVQELRRQIDTA